ncbi:hypothetical protein FXO37_35321, partial [Capsicum annuum]
MNCMITFKLYMNEVKNNFFDGLKKDLKEVTILTSNGDSDDDEDLGGNPIGVCIGDDSCLDISKIVVGTSIGGNLYKHISMLEKVVLDITAHIKKRRLKKKQKDEQQHKQ